MPKNPLVRPRRRRDLRASGADREAYAAVLSDAFAAERIDTTGLEWRASKVWAATTIGELDDLVVDLVESPAHLPAPTAKEVAADEAAAAEVTDDGPTGGSPAVVTVPRWLKITAAAAVLVVGIVAVDAITSNDSPGLGIIGGSGSDEPADVDMYTAEGMQRVVDDIVEAAGGDTRLTWLGFYGEYALATGPGTTGGTRTADYTWREGDVEVEPSGEELEDPDAELFDVASDLDLAAIARLGSTAARQTGVADVDSLYLFVDRNQSSADHQVEVRVSLSSAYEDGRILADQQGTIIQIEGPGVEEDELRFLRADGLADAFAGIEQRLGGSVVEELLVYGQYVLVSAPPEPGADVVDRFTYNGGSTAYRDGPDSSQPDDLQSVLWDLDELDPEQLAAQIEEAARQLEIRDATSTYVNARRSSSRRGQVEVSVYVSGPYDSGGVVFDLAGNVVDTY